MCTCQCIAAWTFWSACSVNCVLNVLILLVQFSFQTLKKRCKLPVFPRKRWITITWEVTTYCWWFRNPKANHRLDVKNSVNNGINYQPQLVSKISEPSTGSQETSLTHVYCISIRRTLRLHLLCQCSWERRWVTNGTWVKRVCPETGQWDRMQTKKHWYIHNHMFNSNHRLNRNRYIISYKSP